MSAPDAPSPPSLDDELLRAFGERLAHLGYGEYLASFDPLTPGAARARGLHARAPEPLRPLIDLLLLGAALPRPRVDELLPGLVDGLREFGLLADRDDGALALPGLMLLAVCGRWLLAQPPGPRPLAYCGDDSIALLLRLQPREQGRALDLCAGPGLQALHLAGRAREVVAVELHPFAAALARINVALNALGDRVAVRAGDLFAPVAGERFDTVVANPPYLPFPDDAPYPLYGHGGADGLRVVRRILAGLPDALAPGGSAQLVGALLTDGREPLALPELRALASAASLDLLVTLTSHQPLAPGSFFFELLVDTAAAWSGTDRTKLADHYLRSLDSQRATHLSPCFFKATQGRGHFSLMDVSHDKAGLWFA